MLAWHGTLEGSLGDEGMNELVLVGVDEVLHMVASFVASHALLLLATVLHSTPTLHPFDYLVWLLFAIQGLFCAAEALRTGKLLGGFGA